MTFSPGPARDHPKTGGRIAQTEPRRPLNRLGPHQDDVLRFATNFAVPSDNNQAERDIRMVKLRQKVSGCLRSTAGAENFVSIRSVMSFFRKLAPKVVQCRSQTTLVRRTLLISPLDPRDGPMIADFLNSAAGQRQRAVFAVGTIIPRISKQAVRHFRVARPISPGSEVDGRRLATRLDELLHQ